MPRFEAFRERQQAFHTSGLGLCDATDFTELEFRDLFKTVVLSRWRHIGKVFEEADRIENFFVSFEELQDRLESYTSRSGRS
jgi:hypothetical protein